MKRKGYAIVVGTVLSGCVMLGAISRCASQMIPVDSPQEFGQFTLPVLPTWQAQGIEIPAKDVTRTRHGKVTTMRMPYRKVIEYKKTVGGDEIEITCMRTVFDEEVTEAAMAAGRRAAESLEASMSKIMDKTLISDTKTLSEQTVQIAGQAVKITRTESHQNWEGKPNTTEGVSLIFYSGKSVYQVMETVNGVKINDKAREVAKQGWDRIRVAVK